MADMETKRRIPYGVINWAELVRECFLVDNTRYIRELETVQTPVFMRPKRFGKSVVCSMLAHYYDVNLKSLFDAYWLHYVKARIPAQAFDKMNENFFRTTFTSRRPDWNHPIAAAVVEVCGSTGYNWFDLPT